MGVWLLNITPVPMRQNQGFLLFLITQSGVKTIEYFHCTCRITKVVIPRSNKEDELCNTKTAVEKGLANSLSERFSCAESAPICQGALFELLGYSADTKTAEEILEGTFIPPPDTDPATIIILEEIARIWSKMGTGKVSITVSVEDFQYYWGRIKERTSSSDCM